MSPSQGCVPISSPPIACPSSIIRPSVALATTVSLPATRSTRPCVKSDARSTGRIGDPVVEVGRELWRGVVDEVEDELTVALRAGETRVYEPEHTCLPGERRLGELAQHAPAHLGVAHHALRHLGAA